MKYQVFENQKLIFESENKHYSLENIITVIKTSLDLKNLINYEYELSLDQDIPDQEMMLSQVNEKMGDDKTIHFNVQRIIHIQVKTPNGPRSIKTYTSLPFSKSINHSVFLDGTNHNFYVNGELIDISKTPDELHFTSSTVLTLTNDSKPTSQTPQDNDEKGYFNKSQINTNSFSRTFTRDNPIMSQQIFLNDNKKPFLEQIQYTDYRSVPFSLKKYLLSNTENSNIDSSNNQNDQKKPNTKKYYLELLSENESQDLPEIPNNNEEQIANDTIPSFSINSLPPDSISKLNNENAQETYTNETFPIDSDDSIHLIVCTSDGNELSFNLPNALTINDLIIKACEKLGAYREGMYLLCKDNFVDVNTPLYNYSEDTKFLLRTHKFLQKRFDVLVFNVPSNVKKEQLRAHFSRIGNVIDVILFKNRGGSSKGIARITFEKEEDANKAVEIGKTLSFPVENTKPFLTVIRPARDFAACS